MDGINNKNISANIPQQDCLNNQQPETQKQTGNPPNDSQGYIPKDNGINSEIPQGSMIDRKIEKLKAEGRDYQLRKVNPSEEVSLIRRSFTENLSPGDLGILQYFSKGEFENFNCEVNNTVNGDMIACRHLAYAFATGEFGTKEAGKFSYIDTVDKISQHSGIKEDWQMPDIFRSHTGVPVREAYYFGFYEVGVALQVALEQQKSEGHEEKSYLFHSHGHAMPWLCECTVYPVNRRSSYHFMTPMIP